MLRRDLLKSLAATSILHPVKGRTEAPPQKTVLRLHSFVPQSSHIWTEMLNKWMEKVRKISHNEINFQAFSSMQLGGTPAQLYDQAKDGVVDIAWTALGNTPGRFPRMEVFELPFVVTNAEKTSEACWKYYEEFCVSEFAGVKPLAISVHGPGHLHTTKQEITQISDFNNLKMRGSTRQVTKLLAAIGATPIGMPLTNVTEALIKGVLDGAALTWSILGDIKVEEILRFHAEFPEGESGLYTTVYALVMNEASFDRLPQSHKEILKDNSGLSLSKSFGKSHQNPDGDARIKILEAGHKIHTFSSKEKSLFIDRSSHITEQWKNDLKQQKIEPIPLLLRAKELVKIT